MIAEVKRALRQQMRELRAEASARDPDAGETIAQKFPLKLFERYGPGVSGYWPIGSEIDPRPLMQRLAKAGADLSLPRIEADGAISFRAWREGDPLEETSFGLSEPLGDAPVAHPTLILMPMLAFDGLGNRLGYGRGHYDKALATMRSDGRAFACGLAFHVQMLDELPMESHDEPLDWAVTERGSVPIFMMRTFAQNGDGGDGNGPGAA